MNELLKVQQGILKIMSQDVKEIHRLIKQVRKEVRNAGTAEEIKGIDASCRFLKKQMRPLEQQLVLFKFKDATPKSVASIQEIAREVKEQKQKLLEAFSFK
ncbi:hypothetical protein [Solibacillus daqui]|uniref:hypothetical protein n=1 Tax=Solibacillus daqui TaxID=2912187 RepID=UPI0023660708|nr:hypothetical protein [Solibacillus daqui]